MTRQIILSSGNKHKLSEIRSILKNMPFEIISKDEVGYEDFDVEEDGETLEANAFKKAESLHELIDGIVIADDTGLFVDALNGEPGVYSARYAGESVSYKENNNLLLKNLDGVSAEKRTAFFKTVIAVVFEDGSKLMVQGSVKGTIAFEERGENGFGYDPLFIVEGTGKTFAEMTAEEKNKLSHRARALTSLKERLEELNENTGN